MGKKRERIQNPQAFFPEENESLSSKRRSKSREGRKQQQAPKEEKLLSSGMSSKILKEAMIQQREIEEETVEAQNPNSSLLNVSEVDKDDEKDDIDDFDGFDETKSTFGDYDVSSRPSFVSPNPYDRIGSCFFFSIVC